MSFTFDILGTRSVSYGALWEAAALPELLSEEKIDRNTPLTGIVHLYLNGISCRSSEVSKNSQGYSVRITSPSSSDDHGLALLLVEKLAELSGAKKIKGEGDPPVDAKQLRQRYGGKWIREQVDFGLRSLLSIAREMEAGEACSVQGAVRMFCIGSQLSSEILASGSPQQIADEFFLRFHEVQYADQKGYFSPKIYVLTANKRKVCGLGPDVAYLIPWVKYVVLATEDGANPMFVAHNDFLKIVGGRLRRLDEKQMLMDAIPKGEWPKVLALASEFAVSPAGIQA